MSYDKKQIENILKKRLERKPTENELINAEKDTSILCEALKEIIDNLEKRVKKLENL